MEREEKMNRHAWIMCIFAQIIPVAFAIAAMVINTPKAHLVCILGAIASVVVSGIIDITIVGKTTWTQESLAVFKSLRY